MDGLEQVSKELELAIANENYRQFDSESAKRKDIITDTIIVLNNRLDYETYVCVMAFFELKISLSREEVEYINKMRGREK